VNKFSSVFKFEIFTAGESSSNQQYEKTYWLSTHFQVFWHQAKTLCSSYGLEFVSVDSIKESNHFLGLCEQNIGLFDLWTHIGGLTTVGGSRTEWYWVESGKKLNFNLKFGAGQPDNAGGDEMCLSLGRAPGNFFYNDIPCYGVHAYKFICQSKSYF
jgi:hypothetical protein